MANESARGLILPVSILVAVAVGVLIGTTLARPPASTPPAREDATVASDLSKTLAALTLELERLRQSTTGLSLPPPQSSRSEAVRNEGGDATRQIEDASKRIAATLEQMRSVAASFGAERRPLIVPSAPPDPTLSGINSDDERATIRKYQMWTYQEVMDQFGAPTSVRNSGAGILWTYTVSPDKTVMFTFADGRVVQMSW